MSDSRELERSDSAKIERTALGGKLIVLAVLVFIVVMQLACDSSVFTFSF